MSWTEEQIDSVWKKGRIIDGVDGDTYRVDPCGAWMMKAKHGKTTSLGWQIDHVFPESKAMARGYSKAEVDHIENLRPMQWKNNETKNDDYPDYKRAVTREGNKNVSNSSNKTVHEATMKKLNQRFKIKRK